MAVKSLKSVSSDRHPPMVQKTPICIKYINISVEFLAIISGLNDGLLDL